MEPLAKLVYKNTKLTLPDCDHTNGPKLLLPEHRNNPVCNEQYLSVVCNIVVDGLGLSIRMVVIASCDDQIDIPEVDQGCYICLRNTWVPYPLSFTTWQSLARKSGFASTWLLAQRTSRFMGEIYSALSCLQLPNEEVEDLEG